MMCDFSDAMNCELSVLSASVRAAIQGLLVCLYIRERVRRTYTCAVGVVLETGCG